MLLLNLSSLTISSFKSSISLLLCLSLFACSTTKQVNQSTFSDNGYAKENVSDHYFYSQFHPSNENSIKKPLPSDHLLMMSLLNRALPTDQVMMLAFEQQKNDYYGEFYPNYAIQIKGDKHSDYSDNETVHAYAKQISLDINAVRINAPK